MNEFLAYEFTEPINLKRHDEIFAANIGHSFTRLYCFDNNKRQFSHSYHKYDVSMKLGSDALNPWRLVLDC